MYQCEHWAEIHNGKRSSVTAFFPTHPDSSKRVMVASSESHPHYDSIVKALREGDRQAFYLFDVERGMNAKFEQLSPRISVRNGVVYKDLVPVHSSITDQILRFMEEGVDDYKPLVAFMERIEANPSEHSREHLYNWLVGSGKFTINEDGMIVAYKGVSEVSPGEYRSIHSGPAIVNGQPHTSGQVPNAPGSVVQMPRDQVTTDPNVHCSVGLHVGDWSYASGFGSVVLEVLVDPADFVSVPNDHNCKKARVWRYTVVDVKGRPYDGPLKTTEDYFDEEEFEDEEYDPYAPDYF